MIKFKKLTLRNFMSVGNVTETIELDNRNLTLILGENSDINDSNARNGVGKSTIMHALSYVLYGYPLTNNIKKDNLINKTNEKNMLTTIDFEKDGVSYRIERGRKPNKFVWKINNETNSENSSDETEGSSKWTQNEIEKTIGISYTLFRHIIILNTYTEPFLTLSASKQREIIEELLGITILSEKAENLKEKIKATKDEINKEESKINANIENNKRTEKVLKDVENKIKVWENKQKEKTDELTSEIKNLKELDIEKELENHNKLEKIKELDKEKDQLTKEKKNLEKQINQELERIEKIEKNIVSAKNNKCPTCNQPLNDEKHKNVLDDLNKEKTNTENNLNELEDEYKSILDRINTIEKELEEYPNDIDVFYKNISDAENHQNKIENAEKELEKVKNQENPHVEHLETLKQEGFAEIDYTYLNELKDRKEHQDFLYKLLTNKDSFIRKKIIDQNIYYLNSRLKHYLTAINMIHRVRFSNDLNVEIDYLGEDYDFDNLSRGEKNRVIICLSWAFRDIYESLRTPYNLLMIDEILDNGFDTLGVENTLNVLKKINSDLGKDIFLVSNREHLTDKVKEILKVKKENGFTTFDIDN